MSHEFLDVKGGRGQCPRCKEWHNNVSYHTAHECEWPFPQGHRKQVERDLTWGRIANQVVGAEIIVNLYKFK